MAVSSAPQLAVKRPLGGISQTDALMLFGIHSSAAMCAHAPTMLVLNLGLETFSLLTNACLHRLAPDVVAVQQESETPTGPKNERVSES